MRVEAERTRLLHAPLVIGVVSCAAPHFKIPEWEQMLSAGAATMNLIVAANALGFVTAWLTEWFSYDERVAEGLGLVGAERFVGFVHVGRPTVVVEDRVRPVMADLVTSFLKVKRRRRAELCNMPPRCSAPVARAVARLVRSRGPSNHRV